MSRKRGIAKWFDTIKRHRFDEFAEDSAESFTTYTVVNGERYRNLVANHFTGYDEVDDSQKSRYEN